MLWKKGLNSPIRATLNLRLSKIPFKFFCDKSEILYVKPKCYAEINNIIPPEHYSDKYKLKFG